MGFPPLRASYLSSGLHSVYFLPRAVVFSLCVTLLRFGWFLVAGQARMRRGTEGKCYESKIVCRGMGHRTVLIAISGRFGGSESSSRGLVAVATMAVTSVNVGGVVAVVIPELGVDKRAALPNLVSRFLPFH
ncbi:predicted protein [Histoplasma capsulatum var. duboisii H88]|uniref:Predicted protein n=1 Tax=Ajellomyces capsulatus (strain H88) TaxID=544711 RepID=F0UBE4_AJEC8|nr:predicted protein [Histoplasma capsulatum var. duboisii H88]